MEIYLVGGAVRDQLLGLPIKEKDWVVVGATVNDMLKKGFRQVGKEFPVFLHPKTNEEYALARKERKVSPGYTGFEFDTSPDVTLEEDLLRRDLTINAMAQTNEGALIDPYHGKADCEKKILRHVSPAFSEDPVRVLRVARFAARFHFSIAEETLHLMQNMLHSGELNALVPERVWKEFQRALEEPYPHLFFETLAKVGALKLMFPMIKINSHGWQALARITAKTKEGEMRFAALLHDVAITDIKSLCERYRAPERYCALAVLVAKEYPHYQQIEKFSAEEILDFLQRVDAFRRIDRFKEFLLVCDAISESTLSKNWLTYYDAAANIDLSNLDKTAGGPIIAETIKKLRRQAIQSHL